MSDRRHFLKTTCAGLLTAVTSAACLQPSQLNAASTETQGTSAEAFAYPTNSFIQIEISDLSRRGNNDTYTAYRITSQGRLSAAQWTPQRRLIGISARPSLSPLPFDALLRQIKGEFGWLSGGSSSSGSQFNNTLSLAHSTAHKTRFRLLHAPLSKPMTDLAGLLSKSISLTAPKAKGAYVIGSPTRASTARDLKIGPSHDRSVLAHAIIDSLSSDRIAVPIEMDRDVARFFTGENTNRLVFTAELERRLTHFTVVKTY